MNLTDHPAAPLVTAPVTVQPEWIDGNGHMNVGWYSIAFDRGLDEVMDKLGCGWNYTAAGDGSVFILESHIRYLAELMQGDQLQINVQMLDADSKRMHYHGEIMRLSDGTVAASVEQLSIHISQHTRRAAPWPAAIADNLQAVLAAHRQLPQPPDIGRQIGIRR